MRALLWKEFAEHARWAALASIVLFLLVLGFHHFQYRSTQSASFSLEVHLSACWFALAWAATLALLQFLRDGRDEWQGLLVHRHVRIDTITWAKLLTGMALLASSMGIPLLLAGLCWLSPSPDTPPFFLLDLTHLGLAVACSALSGYAAAATIAVRSSRWWTTRCAPILIPIVVIVPSWTDVLLSCALTLALVPVLLVATVAWQRAGGRDRQVGWGGVVAWSLCALLPLAGLVLMQVKKDRQDHGGPSWAYTYQLLKDGTVIEEHVQSGVGWWVSNLAGDTLDQSVSHQQASLVISNPDPDEAAKLTFLDRLERRQQWFDGPLSAYSSNAIQNDVARRIVYYYSPSQAAIVAADKPTGRMLGFVTTAGLSPRRRERLTTDDYNSASGFFWNEEQRIIYILDAATQSLRPLFALDSDEVICSGCARLDKDDGCYWIATGRRLVRIGSDGKQLAAYALPAQIRGCGNVWITRGTIPGSWSCVASIGDWSASDVHSYQLTLHDADGQVTSRELPRIPFQPKEPLADAGSIALLEPPGLAVAQSAGRTAPALSILGTLLAMGVALWIGRRGCLSTWERSLWCLAMAALGALPLAPMVALRGGVVREPCPACGRARLVTRQHCEHCGAPFPAPPLSPYVMREAEAPAHALASLTR